MDTDLLTVVIITLAFFSQSIFGFGGGLISIPLLSLFYPVSEAVTLVLIFQLLMGLLIVKTYKQTRWNVVLPLIFGICIGVLIGMAFLTSFDEKTLRLILATSILVYLLKSLAFPAFSVSDTGRGTSFVFGVIGGIFQGIIGTGGPVFVMFLSSALKDAREIRAGVIFLLVSSNVLRISLSAAAGLITERVVSLAALTAAPFLIAIIAGQLVHTSVSQKAYRYCIYAILLCSSISLVFK